MSTALARREAEQLRATLTTLLTPLNCSSPALWRKEVAQSIQRFLGVDGCVVVVDVPGEPKGIGVGQWQGLESVVNTWTEQYHMRNPLDLRRRQLNARVWTRFGLMRREAFYQSAYYHDWCRPSGNLDSAGISSPVLRQERTEALVFVTSASADRFEAGGHEEHLLGLLQPAFAAAISLLALAGSWRDALGSALDLAGIPIALVRADGGLIHATPALLTLVAALPNGGGLLAGAQALARDMAPLLRRGGSRLPTPTKLVIAQGSSYELRATLIEASHLSPGPIVLIAVSGPATAVSSAADLVVKFGFTMREAEVALRLVVGERDRGIAAALGISHNTVRRHVERVLAKLGVHTRAAVASRIRV